jgi:hypothetical protein
VIDKKRKRKTIPEDEDGAGGASGNGLADLTKDELLQRASKEKIRGRSKMSKKELLDALS